jgi:hypothetical protein
MGFSAPSGTRSFPWIWIVHLWAISLGSADFAGPVTGRRNYRCLVFLKISLLKGNTVVWGRYRLGSLETVCMADVRCLVPENVFILRYRQEHREEKGNWISGGEEVWKIMCCSLIFLILRPVIQFLQQGGDAGI